jgi:hypothetical protein
VEKYTRQIVATADYSRLSLTSLLKPGKERDNTLTTNENQSNHEFKKPGQGIEIQEALYKRQ